jgi:hydroxymethylbilane synthase
LTLRIATRGSALAVAQAGQVAELLGGAELVEVSSDGEVGDKARFVRGVERALLAGEADIGVHSAKDLPAEMPEGLAIAAVPAREDPADVLVGAPSSGISRSTRPEGSDPLGNAPEGARVGTASLRRRAQLLAARPDLEVGELHGNVDTRLRRVAEGEFDAIVLAAAGLRRLGREGEASFALPAETMVPAAGQGALVLQTRTAGNDDGASPEAGEAARAAASIGDGTALRELTAERAVVALLDATCASPIGVHARVIAPTGDHAGGDGEIAGGDDASLLIEAFVGLPDGSEWIRDRVEGDAEEPAAAGMLLAERLLGAGAREILDRAEALA